MELKVMLKDQAPHALPHGAFFRIDPQDRGALRQGDFTFIHSAPTEDGGKPSFRGDAEHRTRNLEIPRCAIAPGMTEQFAINARDEPSSSPPTAPGSPYPDASPSTPHRACRRPPRGSRPC